MTLLQNNSFVGNIIKNGIANIGENNKVAYLATRYFHNGDLNQFVLDKPLEPSICRKFFREILVFLKEIHSKGFYFRNLTLDSLYLDDNCDLKVVDFQFFY